MTDDEIRAFVTRTRRNTRNPEMLGVCDWIEKQLAAAHFAKVVKTPKRSRAAYMRAYRKKQKQSGGDFG